MKLFKKWSNWENFVIIQKYNNFKCAHAHYLIQVKNREDGKKKFKKVFMYYGESQKILIDLDEQKINIQQGKELIVDLKKEKKLIKSLYIKQEK